MPSAPRDFMAHVPVVITTRCILRADLFDELNIEKKFRQLVARFAPPDQVEVFGWVFLRNHLHMLVSQNINGHDKRRKRGISPFLRNVFAALAKYVNGRLSSQGRVFERTFLARNRSEADEIFASFAYILTNPVHHGAAKRPEDYAASAVGAYYRGEADGVTTAALGLFSSIEGTSAEKGQFVEGLVREWSADVRAAGKDANKIAIAGRVLREHRDRLNVKGAREAIPIASWLGRERAVRARDELLSWVPSKAEFQPRRAPRVGEIIRVVVRSQERPPVRRDLEDAQDDLA